MLPKTLMLAEDESRRARCFFVGTEHLFLAIAKHGGPQVAQFTAKHGVVLAEAMTRVRGLLHYWKPDEDWSGLLQHTPRLRRISRRATYLAEREAGKPPSELHFLAAFFEDRRGHTIRAILPAEKSSAGGESLGPTKPQGEEEGGVEMKFEAASEAGQVGRTGGGRESILEHFGRDLTQLASENELSPYVGGQRELQMLARTLTRQTKPNPIIVGEPGTGKTALVEGLAQWIVAGRTPTSLASSRIMELSLSSLVAGTQYRGEFEKRIELILAELAARPDVILFLDEFHQAIGGGAAGNNMDAANVLKPALARGEIRCIAATTLREYRKHIEPDSALSRRFQPIMLNEPDENTTLQILHGLKSRLEQHHGVSIADEAVRAAVRLSARYESERHQPDKSIDLLDDACTRVTVPTGVVEGVESALIVTAEPVARAVSDRTGIPVASLTENELERLANLEHALARGIQGQEEAVAAVTNALREIRLGLREDERPQAVFLFTGPTGVGKTALAQHLAHEFFGLKEALIRIDLSEFMEAHHVSRLIGAPPGYVGHDEQGQLTRSLRARPFSLVLLDEIEKAHPRVCDVFLQVFGSGRLSDSRGNVIDCRQAFFVMTSNLGAEAYDEEAGFGFQPRAKDPESREAKRVEAAWDACRKHFRPEFLNRIDRIICFNPLSRSVMRRILDCLVEEMADNLRARGVDLTVRDAVREALVREAGTDQGVPPMKRLLRDRILNRVVELMVHEAPGASFQVVAELRDERIEVNAE
ncbi:MAG: AAA family ATPase [Planctomycetota bacterium]